jgi:DNA repair protein RecO (recombination protein O)
LGLKKDSGIIISAKDMNEADRLITVLSQEGPRQNYFIRGLRKSKSRSKPAAELGSFVEINYYDREGKDWKDVKETHLINRFDEIKSSVIGLYFLSYISEICSLLLPEGENHTKEAVLIIKAMEEVNVNGFYYGILPFVKVRLLGYLGLFPEDFLCVDCGEDLWIKKEADVNDTSLEMFCGECRSIIKNKINTLKLFKDCSRVKFSELFSREIPMDWIKDLDRILNHFLESYLGRSLKTSKEFYRLLENEPIH